MSPWMIRSWWGIRFLNQRRHWQDVAIFVFPSACFRHRGLVTAFPSCRHPTVCAPLTLVLSWGGRIHIHEYVYTTPTCMSWDSMGLCQVLRRHACHEIECNYATRHKGTRERVFWTQRKVRFWEGSRRHTLPLADLLSQNALSSYQTCKLRQ